MLNLVMRIVHKLLTLYFDKPLPATTTQEMELVDHLRKSVLMFPIIQPKDAPPSEKVWINYMNRLHELVLNNDPREFLRWDVVQKTMFVGYASYIRKELNYLKTLPEWNNRWHKAIKESLIGHPTPYPLFPSSSGNLIHHAYHLVQFEEKTGIRVNEMNFIFEFGGGYGSMCRAFYNLGFNGKYVIFDLPIFSEIQRFFLRSIDLRVDSIDTFSKANSGVICISDFEQLKVLLSNGTEIGQSSMFVATWSISETPIRLRYSILPLVTDCKAFLIAYQHRFGEVDNLEFFDQWKGSFNNQIVWHNWEIKHLPGNSYIIGKRLDT